MTKQRKTGIARRFKGFMLKRMHRMITCREFEDFVLNYLDDELSVRQRSVFEFHVRICRECREYLAAYKRSIELGRAASAPLDGPIPQDVPADLIKAVLEARKQ